MPLAHSIDFDILCERSPNRSRICEGAPLRKNRKALPPSRSIGGRGPARARSPCVALFPTALSLAHQLRRDRARSKSDGRTDHAISAVHLCGTRETNNVCGGEPGGTNVRAISSLLVAAAI